MSDTQEALSSITRSLHWLIGLSIIALIAVGIYMEETETFALYPIHKSLGVLVFPFVLFRVIWRMKEGWPSPAGNYSTLEHVLSKAVHWVLIIGTVAFPISGMMMSGAGGHGIPLFGLELLAANPDPANPMEVIPLNKDIAGLGHTIHGIAGNVMILAIVLHLVGALKHHLVDKDSTLRRMIFSKL